MFSVLKVEEFQVFRRGIPLIKPVSFELRRGQIVRVTGENGTGKTTLLESVIGRHREWSGSLKIEAKDISYKRQRGVAFESLTLREAWELVVGVDSAEYYRSLLKILALDEISSRAIGLLSGGEAQRAMLTLALIRRHDLILLDEPLAGIDAKSVDLIAACLEQHAYYSAVLLVEHKPSQRLQVIEEVCLERASN